MNLLSIVSSIHETVARSGRESSSQWLTLVAAVLATAIFVALPLVLEPFLVTVTVSFLFSVVLALSWNLLAMTGYVNFGHVMFIGLGAFTAGHLTLRTGIGSSMGLGVVGVILAGGFVSALFAAVIGYPLLRLEGHYFAIAALGIAEALRALFLTYGPLQGAAGITMPLIVEGPLLALQNLYYHMFAVAALTVAAAYLIKDSKFGYGFRAVHLGEDAAEMLGVPTTRYAIFALVLSGFFAGLGGAVYAYWLSFIESPNVFNIILTIEAIVMAMMGGIGTVLGPIVGAGIYTFLTGFLLDTYTTEGRLFITGFAIVLIVLFAPEGLVV